MIIVFDWVPGLIAFNIIFAVDIRPAARRVLVQLFIQRYNLDKNEEKEVTQGAQTRFLYISSPYIQLLGHQCYSLNSHEFTYLNSYVDFS